MANLAVQIPSSATPLAVVDGKTPIVQVSQPEQDSTCQFQRSETEKTLVDEEAVCAKLPPPPPPRTGWNGPDDPENPKNWSMRRKWLATITVAMFTFITPVASSMIAPALQQIASELHVQHGLESSMLLSIFVLAYIPGPWVLGPMSEVFGRTRVLQSAYMFFLFFCLACGFAQTKAQFLAFRFISGLGGSAPLAIGPGVLADLWPPEQRGKALGLYTAGKPLRYFNSRKLTISGPLLGPAIAPIFGELIVQHVSWRWIFWSLSIFTGLTQIVGFFALRETYAPVLLARRARQSNELLSVKAPPPLASLIAKALKRPLYLLFTQPILQCLATYQLYNYGVIYLVLTTFPTIWTNIYHQSAAVGSLNYISIGLGFLLASLFAGSLNDRIYIHLKQKNSGIGRPEFRIPLMFPASFLVVSGLFIYGWTVHFHLNWILPNIGIFLFATGCIISYQCALTYNIDTYTKHAASSMSAVVMLRSLAGFAFPLFAPSLYDHLGYGWGNSLLGFIAIGIGMTAPVAFWVWGAKLRWRSAKAVDELNK